MRFFSHLFGNPRLIVPVGICFALSFLLIDAGVDMVFFDEEKRGFVENLLEPEPMDKWMRLIVTVFIISFAFYARHLLKLQVVAAEELARERDLLEVRIADATHDLRQRNDDLQSEIEVRQKIEHELKALSVTDPLTRLYNRRKLLEELNARILVDSRYHTGLALIFCDIDHFKRVNDTFGHDVGDTVLQQFADLLRQNTRESDTVARWGGEEFAILLPLDNAERAEAIAEKFRTVVAQADFDIVGTVTCSLGVALFVAGESPELLIKRADTALYAAKAAGRNRVALAVR